MGVKLRREGVAQTNPFMGAKVEPFKIKKEVPIESKGKFDTQSIHNHDIKCFRCVGVGRIASQCSDKNFIILKDHNEIEYKSDKFKEGNMLPLEDCNDGDVEYPTKNEYLVIRHTLNVQIK